jgi:hypothetical protein
MRIWMTVYVMRAVRLTNLGAIVKARHFPGKMPAEWADLAGSENASESGEFVSGHLAEKPKSAEIFGN